ncbi:AAA domain-containing protein [Kibdelosporangium aridum]|nr:AAA domain-containing protein [Kibdelosporangium aridum]
MAAPSDLSVLDQTISLMDFLAEVTDAAERDPVRDILADETGAPDPLIWLGRLPDGVRLTPRAADDILLRVRPPKTVLEPRPPALVAGWIDSADPRGPAGPEPRLLDAGPVGADVDQLTAPPTGVRHAFDRWLADWRQWSVEQSRSRGRRELYETLEKAAKTLEQQDDEYEFVLAAGLVCWHAPDGEKIRRHLVTEPVRPRLDRETAEVTVSFIGGKRRFEDRELFSDQETYVPDRGRTARQAILDSDNALLDEKLLTEVEEWLGLSIAGEFTSKPVPADVAAELPATLELTASPALLLRPRSRELLAETYRRIAAQLREPDAEVPVALAQLVADTEADTRARWLTEQNAVPGDVLGSDPLFPLPTNEEQERVIDLLKREIGVVVQGPPGTGKTHTIANLVSALLARGMRVLVTSQKDQALKVLRDKIPPDLRSLCVLLAGGSKDAAKELERGLDALSEAISSPSTATLGRRAAQLAEERHALRSRSAKLNDDIRQLREVEYREHDPVVPGYSTDAYAGTLTDIVRQVQDNAASYNWMPPVDQQWPDRPPLSTADLLELLQLTRTDRPSRRIRADQQIPGRNDLPNAGELADIITSEENARKTAHEDTSQLTQRLAALGSDILLQLRKLGDEARTGLGRLGYGEDYVTLPERNWVASAVGDHLANRHRGLWQRLFQVRDEASRLQQLIQAQGLRFAVDLPSVHEYGIGKTRGLLNTGRQLRDYLESGGKVRKFAQSAAQKAAKEFLSVVRVDGRPPDQLDPLDAALERLEAEVAAVQLIELWAEADVDIRAQHLTRILSELADNGRLLGYINHLTQVQAAVNDTLLRAGLSIDLSTVAALVRTLDAVPAALKYVSLERARHQVAALQGKVTAWASAENACSELGLLVKAVAQRDLDAYRSGLDAIDVARHERAEEHRRGQLARTLRNVHPALFELFENTAADPAWETRLRDLPAAWAWSKAEQYILATRNADDERRLVAEFDQVEDEINRVTEQLAGVRALQSCLDRMTDTHARALRSYREHMSHIGAGGGSKVREFRKAARRAMEKAKDAVPAWVVPLPNLLENIAAVRDSFDVVIVDEASQVGLEQLFLLWMAPRVIVVGDDKQCTPGGNRLGKLDPLFAKLEEYLSDVDYEIRHNFTPKSHLYGLLSARSGKDAVVRLREHFRCMPEIINWSSTQFYGEEDRPGLIPLRERKATDLEPLVVVHVEGGYTEGRDARRRNETEAKRIVAQLAECLVDPRYQDKTFGVVVLQSTGQVKLLEHEINATISAEDRQKRKIRVGTPPTFQGDERDVIFLSMVVAEPPRAQRAPLMQQAYNVAASRAKDQMWLFTSIRIADLKPDDLRASLMSYMLAPPSVFGTSPGLDEVSDTARSTLFDSLFEQKVFREIKKRGYFVVPQYPVGTRRLDLVVVGSGGRLAVECDGHLWHTSTAQQVSDARRDRELRRMGWDVVRIRESEFEFDPARELAPLWQRLEQRDIHPDDITAAPAAPDWSPVDLPNEDTTTDLDEGSNL